MRTNVPIRCAECAIAAAVDAQRQMAARAGPVWDKFRAAMDAKRGTTPTRPE